MRRLGRGLQVVGLVLPLTGLMMSLSSRGGMDAMGYEFGMLAGGAALFMLGWSIQSRAGGDA